MFGAPGLGFTEIVVLGILALLVVGPKDLPLMLRKLGRWTARLRGMAAEFRSGFDELARQAELDDLKREVDALRRDAQSMHESVTRPIQTLARSAVSPIPQRPVSGDATSGEATPDGGPQVDPDPGPPESPERDIPAAPEIRDETGPQPEIPQSPPPAPETPPAAPIPTTAYASAALPVEPAR